MENKKWYEKTGNEGDMVLSSRVRLARNLREYPFPGQDTPEQKREIQDKVEKALLSGSSFMRDQFDVLPLENMPDEAAVSYVERHIVSPEYISNREGRSVLLSKDEGISIMVNEEDHVRIQVIREGLALKEVYETADRIDTLLNECLTFAFDEELGYLTHCPTNLGTGMRVSVMMHLPALTEYGLISRTGANLSKLGIVIRGTYGEGSQVQGALYQLSNQITLGISEREAIENLRLIVMQLANEERRLRGQMAENVLIQDRIHRSAGLLKSAKVLSSAEFCDLTSNIRLGVATGILTGISAEEINTLYTKVQPATIAAQANKKLSQRERDILRAEITRDACKNLKE